MPIEGLPQSERAAVFRAVVSILRNDPVLSSVVRTFLAWEGTPQDPADLSLGMAPALRLTPTGGGDEWMSPASMVGPLIINVEVMTAGYNVDDPANLWRAVIAAIYDPQGRSFADIQAQLRAAGAYPPSPKFTMPAFDPKPESNFCYGVAQIQVMVQNQLGTRGAGPGSSS
jgi:hypothetical protein